VLWAEAGSLQKEMLGLGDINFAYESLYPGCNLSFQLSL